MSKALVLQQFGITTGKINYSKEANVFLSTGITSQAGNTYFNAVRFAEGIAIKEDVGIGWAHKFLNGLKIYSLKDQTLLADISLHNVRYNKYTIKHRATEMLMEVLKKAARKEGLNLKKKQARKEIERIVDMALNEDQMKVLQRQSQKYLGN